MNQLLKLLVFQMTDCLTSVKSVNKTDTLSLLSTFGASCFSLLQAGG